ncbi:outer membrane lipoprotein carrier protein LolA [uncultured Maribacter sp.]|uniref:LolA family protein n=1 Tax=uncultured Maribacter sp. TaxID=431308 RepID=UPI002612F526|nr:outer membrane lipoprotein carrier protein LolA [uncultured Maribacter sp.]
MNKIVCLLFFIAFGGINAQTKMSAQEAEILKNKVKARADETQSISSDFTQYKHLDFLSNDIESKGKLAFKSPNTVKWEYVKPFAYSVLFKGETLYINNEGDKSNVDIGSNKLFKELNTLIASSIKGDMFTTEHFAITYFKKGKDNEVHFAPKDPKLSEFIKAFHITFNSMGDVMEVKMIEPSNDYTQIVFSNRELNKAIPDAVFAH